MTGIPFSESSLRITRWPHQAWRDPNHVVSIRLRIPASASGQSCIFLFLFLCIYGGKRSVDTSLYEKYFWKHLLRHSGNEEVILSRVAFFTFVGYGLCGSILPSDPFATHYSVIPSLEMASHPGLRRAALHLVSRDLQCEGRFMKQ